jgi:hypothetical protein
MHRVNSGSHFGRSADGVAGGAGAYLRARAVPWKSWGNKNSCSSAAGPHRLIALLWSDGGVECVSHHFVRFAINHPSNSVKPEVDLEVKTIMEFEGSSCYSVSLVRIRILDTLHPAVSNSALPEHGDLRNTYVI